jgi:arsenite methyltransferase
MEQKETLAAINNRYSGLAESACCLSCGGAVGFADAKEGEVCVDLGSGRGSDTIRLAQSAGPSGFAYGIDVSDGMIGRSQALAKKLGATNVSFIKSDLAAIPIASGTVDCVISNCTINHAPDKYAVWKEIARMLKKGGRFIVSDIYAIEEVPDEYRTDPVAISECWAGASMREEYMNQIACSDLVVSEVRDESVPYAKGKIEVASFTVIGYKKDCCCDCR